MGLNKEIDRTHKTRIMIIFVDCQLLVLNVLSGLRYIHHKHIKSLIIYDDNDYSLGHGQNKKF